MAEYKIDGQLFRTIERTTIENDFFVMKHLRAAGIGNCTPNAGESAEEFATRLLYGIVESGAPFELLGGLLLPSGMSDEEWCPAQAKTTAAILRQVNDPESKAQVQAVLVSVVAGFFQAGLRFLTPSLAASQTKPQPGSEASSGIGEPRF